MKSELINWLRVNGLWLLGVVVSLDAAFLFGYLAISDFPFLHFADFALISSISSQAMLFMSFAAPAILFQVRLNLIEGMIPINQIFRIRWPYNFLFLFSFFLWILLLFVPDLRPGLIGFIAALALIVGLYHPTETHSIGSINIRRIARLLRVSPRRTWRLAMKPYYGLMFRNCAWLFGMILFVWIGFLRFSYVSNDNIQILEIDGRSVETAIVGRNSIGLIGRNDRGDYAVYPLEGISSISLPKQ